MIRYLFSQNPPSYSEFSGGQVASSENVKQDLKGRCFGILCKVCRSHNVLPASCIALDVVSVEKHPSSGFVDIYKGQHAGNPVRIKVFRTRTTRNLEDIKRVCILAVSGEVNFNVILNRGSTVRLWGGNTFHTRTCCPFSGFRRHRAHFVSLALGCQMGTLLSTSNEIRVSIGYCW